MAGSEDGTFGEIDVGMVTAGDCRKLVHLLPDRSIDVLVTSPPYWGQRLSEGTGVEEDPREYIITLMSFFEPMLSKLKDSGIAWINIGDAFNTPVNWRKDDYLYSTLGSDKSGLPAHNSAYTKPRFKRRAFIDEDVSWLTYGNLLGLPYRLVTSMCDAGWLFRGEVIWRKLNPMPEGRCRRPHRQHETVYLLTRTEKHTFRVRPPVGTIWEFANEKISGKAHHSRFPLELPQRCIEAYGEVGEHIVVLDPFAGSGSTGLAAQELGCSFIGFEIDTSHVEAANERLAGHPV